MLDLLVSKVTLCVDLEHNRLYDVILLEDLGLLFEYRFHAAFVLNLTLCGGLFTSVEQEHVHDVLHAILDFILHGDYVIDRNAFIFPICFDEIAHGFEKVKQSALEFHHLSKLVQLIMAIALRVD
jgi:hypothetical protein